MSNTESLTLENPIQRGETTITTLTLHKPKGGHLKGISIRAVMDMECDTVQRLLPRICDPKITAQESNNLEPEDLAMAGVKIAGFFLPKSVTESDSPTE